MLSRNFRNLIILLCCAAVVSPSWATRRISIQQLNQLLTELESKSDDEATKQLTALELNEQMSTPSLLHWDAAMPGPKSRLALTAIADSSVFLNPPPGGISNSAPPDKIAQEKLLQAAGAYVKKTLAGLPNFFAVQAVTTYEDSPADLHHKAAYVPLHYANFLSASVLYRGGGKEIMETKRGEVSEKDQTVSAVSGLLSSGEFGPVLETVLTDAQKGKLVWSHWETGSSPEQNVAVFRYSVPRSKSHYKVKVLLPYSSYPAQSRPGYHGEIALDPANGTILRITLSADLISDDPMMRADLMVEYGPVEIGRKSYICPVKSVTLVKVPEMNLKADAPIINADGGTMSYSTPSEVPSQTIVNDVIFGDYKVLRSEAKMLTGPDTQDDDKQP